MRSGVVCWRIAVGLGLALSVGCGSQGPGAPDAGARAEAGVEAEGPADGGSDGAAGDADDGGTAQQCAAQSTVDGGPTECNQVEATGAWCDGEAFTSDDGGVVDDDGGAIEGPAGGALTDGDYDLIRYRTSPGGDRTRRTLRVLNCATLIEWAIDYDDGSTGLTTIRADTTVNPSGNVLNIVAVTCVSANSTFNTTSYGYTASGDELVLFYTNAAGTLANVYTYQRTCTR
jgi:hypothetical protein